MYVEYYPDSEIQEAEIATKAIWMVLVGSAMVIAGLTVLGGLLEERTY